MITERYEYKTISRKNIDGKRHYLTPEGDAVPSVTTILDKTKPAEKMQALLNWKKRVGEAKAQQIVTEAANVGTVMHKKLEEYCLGTLDKPGSNLIQQQADKMARVVIDTGLKDMNECWGVEVPLYYSGLYAGTTDCVGMFKGEPAVLDFKQTNKPKKREWIEDYFLQLSAYICAHDKIHETKIKRGVILMCSRDLTYQQFEIEGNELEFWKNKWWDRVEQFYNK